MLTLPDKQCTERKRYSSNIECNVIGSAIVILYDTSSMKDNNNFPIAHLFRIECLSGQRKLTNSLWNWNTIRKMQCLHKNDRWTHLLYLPDRLIQIVMFAWLN